MTTQKLIEKLETPKGRVDVVLDTDAYNEIDDQFAIAYMLHAPERLNVRAIYAAPFYNDKSSGPEDGMLKSYNEIFKLLDLDDQSQMKDRVYMGSRSYLPDEHTPVDSPAARDLVERAMGYSPDAPLYVVAIGAITNVASAILIEPEIIDRMVLIWLGGNALEWPHNREFNLMQDVAGARVVFGCGVPLVQLPCAGVVDHATVTGPELTHWLMGKSPLCDYLARNTIEEAESYAKGTAWSRVIWDITAVAWLLDEDQQMLSSRLAFSPVPEYDHRYAFDSTRHMFRYVYHVNRDLLFTDLFTRIASKAIADKA